MVGAFPGLTSAAIVFGCDMKRKPLFWIAIAILVIGGCDDPQQAMWNEFDDARMIDNLKSQERALHTLREIRIVNPDAIHRGSSVDTWIEDWEERVGVLEEKEKEKKSMWSY